jgi:hypothetical protein
MIDGPDEGSALSGALTSDGRILVMGELRGEVAGSSIEVTATGALSGRIRAGVLRSRGALGGRLEADDVDLGGRILDQTVIRARGLAVAFEDGDGGGAQFGDCELEIGDEPDRDRAVSEAAAPRGGLLAPDGPR